MNFNDDIDLKKLKPYKKLGYGKERVIILTSNNRYTVKIYRSSSKYMKSYIKLMSYLQKYNLPTIYKSYKLLSKKNSLERYKKELPKYFSHLDESDLMKLSENYNMRSRLIDIMKTYKITLNDFIKEILKKNPKNKDNILKSFYYQAIITLYWLYMKKGIVHKDLSLDNFFIEETNDKNLEITIGENTYNIKLYGYYLILDDFGHARSLELFDASEYPNNLSISFGSDDMNPYYEILTIINIFKKYIKLNFDEYILKLGMFNHNYSMIINKDYRELLKSYIKSKDYKSDMKIFKNTLQKFKDNYSVFITDKILK